MPSVTAARVLAGRVDELALLRDLIRNLDRGSGSAVFIEGEAGMGKTSLARAATESAAPARYQVFWGTGDELGQELPLLPFLDALRVRRAAANARRTAIAGLLRGEVATDRGADVPAMLAEQLIALAVDEADNQPAVLVIDDLQWADPASVQLWGRLARISGRVPLMLIGMTRPAPQREDLLALRRAVEPDCRIQLTALPRTAVADLVGDLAGGRPDTRLLRLADGAAGNPLYLTELLAALARSGGITVTPAGTARLTAASVPGSLAGAIADRLGFVSSPARQVLRAAALLGVEFALTDLAAVLGRTVTDLDGVLDEARASGVLTDAVGGLAFRHPLIREALYAEMPAAVRSAWHRDAARALASAGAPADRVARQLLRSISQAAPPGGHRLPGTTAAAGDLIERPPAGPSASRPADEWMLNWLGAAADSLVSQAPAVAAELLAQAVAGLPAGTDRHGRLASKFADALYRTGDREVAEQVAARALTHASDPDLVVDLHWTLTQCRMLAGRSEESLAILDAALSAPGTTSRHRARLRVLAARTQLYLGKVAAADREAGRALEAATEAGDAWATAWALHVLAMMATVRGELANALPLYDRGLAVTETDPALGDLGLLMLSNKAVALCNLDRWAEGVAAADRAAQLADRVGTALRLTQAHGILGQAGYESGRWDDALAEMSAVPGDLKDPLVLCVEFAIAALIAFHRDAAATARRHLTAAELHAQRVGGLPIPYLLLARSLDREQAGLPGEALATLTASIAANPDDPVETEDLFGDVVRLALKAGDRAVARTVTGSATEYAGGTGIPHRQANALYCRGMVDRDPVTLLAAAERYGDAGRPFPRARALEAAADCLAEAGDLARAQQALEQVAAVYESLGAEADLSRLDAEFRGRGIRRGPHVKRRRAGSGWDSLTRTELKVAALVEEGLYDPEIAARLVLPRRTVATHVSHILEKLGVASRSDIAHESARHAASQAGNSAATDS
jgi:DNA-binding CsgD family transcriptional regulator